MLGQIEGKRRKGVKEDEMVDSITDSMDMNLSKLQEIVEDRGACILQPMGSQRVTKDNNSTRAPRQGCV